MLVTFLRHGQSEHNAGLTTFLDSKLTPLGEQQAAATAVRFQREGFDALNTFAFVSPLLRTLQTLSPTVSLLDIPTEVFTDVCEFFSDRNEGYKSFEGLSPSSISSQFPWAKLGSRFRCDEVWWPLVPENEVSLYDRSSRVRDHLIDSFFGSNRQLLIVSHADPIGRMIESFLRVPPNMEGPPWSANCGVTRLNVTDPTKPAEIVLLNDVSHLTPLSLETPA